VAGVDDLLVRAVATGRVQRVNYRWSLLRAASNNGVRGWVRNRADGAVEAVLQGPRDAVERTLIWMRQGPPKAIVHDVEVEPIEASEQYDGFTIRD
jgi:acylphosphatase